GRRALGVAPITVKRRLNRGPRHLAEQLNDLRPSEHPASRSPALFAAEFRRALVGDRTGNRLEESRHVERIARAKTARRTTRRRPGSGRGLPRLSRAAAGGPPPLAADAPGRGGTRCA